MEAPETDAPVSLAARGWAGGVRSEDVEVHVVVGLAGDALYA